MKIVSLTLQNFQCFGPQKTVIELNSSTAFIGTNGTGKTAALMALCRMFGSSPPLREIALDDFHLPAGEDLDTKAEREFFCEVRIEFPELQAEGLSQGAIPPSFNAMVVSAPGQPPFCRIRLIANWTRTPLEAGEITSRIVWLTATEPDPPLESQRIIAPIDRARIQVFYVPGSRDASRQLANASGTLLNQLLRAVKWNEGIKTDIRDKAEEVRKAFLQLAPVTLINTTSATYWQDLYDDSAFARPTLAFMGSEFNEVLKDTKIVFNPTHGQADQPIERLSDGQQSLFYFAFINTLFSIRRQVYEDHHAPTEIVAEEETATDGHTSAESTPVAPRITDHISYENLRPAPLTLFAIEEPENHLAPHYLARIIRQLEKISTDEGAQVIVTSHCPAIVARIEPTCIRHFALKHPTNYSMVRRLTLPDDTSDAFKYVKQAVMAYPELYFSRLVILGEGDSEEYLLKRFAQIGGSPLDLAFVSVVPLGDRFVRHLWRLLSDLEIPHLTLLHFDQERCFGGWKTIQYALRELIAVLPDEDKIRLLLIPDNDTDRQLTDQELDNMDESAIDKTSLDSWATRLEEFGVFLCRPLDIDFLMLSAFAERYQNVYEGKPRGLDSAKKQSRIDASLQVVLGSDGGDGASFSNDEKELFPWYQYLFLGKGKPTTHALAWLHDESIAHADLPTPLNKLFERSAEFLRRAVEAI